MKVWRQVLAATALSLISSFVCASQLYTFDYTFYNGDKLSGSFSGDAQGDLIGNISNVSAKYAGQVTQAATGFAGSHHEDNAPNYWLPGNAVISINGTGNNFFFQHDGPTAGQYFIFFSVNGDLTAFNDSHTFNNGAPLNTQRWNVTAVPEPETYAMLLLGLGLIAGSARKKSGRA